MNVCDRPHAERRPAKYVLQAHHVTAWGPHRRYSLRTKVYEVELCQECMDWLKVWLEPVGTTCCQAVDAR